MKGPNTKKRIAELDVLRGICVTLMIFDHFMFDLWGLLPTVFSTYPPAGGAWRAVYNISRMYWNSEIRSFVRPIVVCAFLVLVGICTSFSKSNMKRGIKLAGAAIGVSALTFILGELLSDPDMVVLFGILHCISLSLILIGLLERIKCGKWAYLAIGSGMVLLGIYLSHGHGYMSLRSSGYLRVLICTVLGTADSGADSFSLLLYGGVVFIGVFLGRMLYPQKRSLFRCTYPGGMLTLFGRHSLVIYILHQLLIPVLLAAVLYFAGFR